MFYRLLGSSSGAVGTAGAAPFFAAWAPGVEKFGISLSDGRCRTGLGFGEETLAGAIMALRENSLFTFPKDCAMILLAVVMA